MSNADQPSDKDETQLHRALKEEEVTARPAQGRVLRDPVPNRKLNLSDDMSGFDIGALPPDKAPTVDRAADDTTSQAPLISFGKAQARALEELPWQPTERNVPGIPVSALSNEEQKTLLNTTAQQGLAWHSEYSQVFGEEAYYLEPWHDQQLIVSQNNNVSMGMHAPDERVLLLPDAYVQLRSRIERKADYDQAREALLERWMADIAGLPWHKREDGTYMLAADIVATDAVSSSDFNKLEALCAYGHIKEAGYEMPAFTVRFHTNEIPGMESLEAGYIAHDPRLIAAIEHVQPAVKKPTAQVAADITRSAMLPSEKER